METKFTKEDWVCEDKCFDIYSIIETKKGVKIAELRASDVTWAKREERHANAKLISAAPNMFDALVNIANWLVDDTTMPTDEAMESVWVAIEKATGITYDDFLTKNKIK